MCISVLIFFIDKTLSKLLWLCLSLVFENRSNKIINCSGTSDWKNLVLCYVNVKWFYSFLIVFISIHSILLLTNIRMALGAVYNTVINVL